jgi:hypothetical protein
VSRKTSCTVENLNFELCNRVLQVVEAWADHVFRQEQPTKEQRESSGKNHHLNFTWDVFEVDSTITFELCDDATGAESESFDAARWEAQAGLRFSIEGTPERGNILRLTCDKAELIAREYVVCFLRTHAGVYRFAIHSPEIESIYDVHGSEGVVTPGDNSGGVEPHPLLKIHHHLGITPGEHPGKVAVVIKAKAQQEACFLVDETESGCKSKLLVHRDERNLPFERGFILYQGGLVPVVDAENLISASTREVA